MMIFESVFISYLTTYTYIDRYKCIIIEREITCLEVVGK